MRASAAVCFCFAVWLACTCAYEWGPCNSGYSKSDADFKNKALDGVYMKARIRLCTCDAIDTDLHSCVDPDNRTNVGQYWLVSVGRGGTPSLYFVAPLQFKGIYKRKDNTTNTTYDQVAASFVFRPIVQYVTRSSIRSLMRWPRTTKSTKHAGQTHPGATIRAARPTQSL